MNKYLVVLCALVSTPAFAGKPVCLKHMLPPTQLLCYRVYDAGYAAGIDEEEIDEAVKSCGFVNWPAKIRGCLGELKSSYERARR